MRDREFINRFIAFYLLGVSAYKGDMDQFLADALIKVNTFSKENITDLKRNSDYRWKHVMLFGVDHCFRKHTPDQTARNVINAALYDVAIHKNG